MDGKSGLAPLVTDRWMGATQNPPGGTSRTSQGKQEAEFDQGVLRNRRRRLLLFNFANPEMPTRLS